MMPGGYDRSRDGLAAGCCSALVPCAHQRRDPTTICTTCAGDDARELRASERISAAQAVYDEMLADASPDDPDYGERTFDAMKAALARADALRLP